MTNINPTNIDKYNSEVNLNINLKNIYQKKITIYC